MQKGFCNPFRSVTCDAHVQMPYVILKKMVIQSLPSCCFRTCLFFSLSQWPNFLYIFAFGMATERPRMQKWQEGEAWLANRSIACFFCWSGPTSLSCHFCMGGLPRTLPKAKIHKRFVHKTSVQTEKCWKQQGSKEFYTKHIKISLDFVTRVSHVTDPTPLCESLMFFCPFIFATRSEAKNVSFGPP